MAENYRRALTKEEIPPAFRNVYGDRTKKPMSVQMVELGTEVLTPIGTINDIYAELEKEDPSYVKIAGLAGLELLGTAAPIIEMAAKSGNRGLIKKTLDKLTEAEKAAENVEVEFDDDLLYEPFTDTSTEYKSSGDQLTEAEKLEQYGPSDPKLESMAKEGNFEYESDLQEAYDKKLLNKKNTFKDYIATAKYLIDKNYTSEGKIIGMGGSAGGLLMGAVVNEAPELFLGMIMAVPFVDSLTTNLDHSLPLTVGEFDEFGNAKENKEHFDYIYSYAPYNNIKKMDYPHIFITTSLSDNRVLFDEPAKFIAKLRDYKTDNNLLLLKTEMNAGHGGKTGRDSAIEEVALDYAFALKVSDKI